MGRRPAQSSAALFCMPSCGNARSQQRNCTNVDKRPIFRSNPPACYRPLCLRVAMHAKGLTPILNVSDITESFAWFEKLGWKKLWDWGDPPGFGAVGSGACEIFLCQGAQGGRGNGGVKSTFGEGGSETADKGVWMSVWVDDVDAIHRHCLDQALGVAF